MCRRSGRTCGKIQLCQNQSNLLTSIFYQVKEAMTTEHWLGGRCRTDSDVR
jgi:hypothetical protein